MGNTGGDSLINDLNEPFNHGDIAWILCSTALVWLMVPGIGLMYSGMSRKKHALTLVWASIMTVSLVSFQWFFWGYSLAFSGEAGAFLGKLDNFALMNVLGNATTVATLPDICYMLYQCMFAACTGILMVGGAHERARLGPMMLYLFIWMTIVYCPIACWTWNPMGWGAKLGSLDFAGGGPVHMTSGAGALAYALWCGKRHDPVASNLPTYKPHSVNTMVLGTIFLWFGWFGFNGGSTAASNIRSVYAAVNTNLAAACGALTWLFLDYFRTGKWSTVAMCQGVVAGLVGITPAAGFVPVYTSVAIGGVTALWCALFIQLKPFLQIDDGLDVFALHGAGGFMGSVLTGLFAADYIAALDGTEIDGGWMNHHYIQLGYQLATATATLAWAFGISSAILVVMNKIPYLHLRLSLEDELAGTDETQLGETIFDEDLETGSFTGATPMDNNGSSASDVEKDKVTEPVAA